MTKWQDKPTLERLYVDEGLSSRDVADRLGTSKTTILKWLRRHGIERDDANQDKPPAFEMRGPYESWSTHDGEAKRRVYVHRLVAVAEHGFDAVVGNDTHHKNGVPWDNRPSNIEPIDPAEHGRLHSHEYYGLV